jgi:hypothetical protein
MSTTVANSPAYADVNAAVGAANPGDTIVIPPGTATWGSTLTINKSLTLQGNGTSTKIVRQTGFNGDLINITGLPGDVPVRVTGIFFDNVVMQPSNITSDIDITNAGNAAPLWSQIRIDHCSFNGGQYVINWQGRAYGVNDHNTFTNCWVGVHIFGGNGDFGDIAWGRNDYQAGGSHFVFTEDCTFTLNNAFGAAPGSPWVTYHEYGGRSVLRHCTIDSSAFSASMEGPVDAHGNQSYWANISNDYRGTIRFEFYNNLIHVNNSFRLIDARGGSFLIHDNTYICDGSSPHIIDFRDEEDDSTSVPFSTNVRSPVHWPCEDQVTGSFIYNNTYKGRAQQDTDIGVGTFGNSNASTGDPFYIQKNRDFWTQAPAAGTTTVYPAPTGQSNASYPAPFANLQLTSYTPYVYPHPLIPVTPPNPPGGGGGINPPFTPIKFPASPPAPAPVFEDGPGLYPPRYNGQTQTSQINQTFRP